jgi:hypothetical protein
MPVLSSFRYRQVRKEGNIVNKIALAAALALGLSGIAQAKVVDLVAAPAGANQSGATAQVGSWPAFALPSGISELPEPEVFAMMLVGLILLGYRARRDSNEKFK